MSDFKSKLPDFKELTAMTGKLFKGLKNSVDEIIQDYKEKRASVEEKPVEPTPVTPEKEEATPKTDESKK